MTHTDDSRPGWPREVAQAHLDADADHAPTADDLAGPGYRYDNCGRCGLATTSDGERHGFDV